MTSDEGGNAAGRDGDASDGIAPSVPVPRASHPYGPSTARIRRFLVRLAALGDVERDAVVQRFGTIVMQRDFAVADAALADLVARSGRGDARDSLAGPLLQIARRRATRSIRGNDAPREETVGDAELHALTDAAIDTDDDLDPVAEPALAALLALLVDDLLPPPQMRLLYGAFDESIPLSALGN
jgi:hypothetical protein